MQVHNKSQIINQIRQWFFDMENPYGEESEKKLHYD